MPLANNLNEWFSSLSSRGRAILIGALSAFTILPLFWLVYNTSNNNLDRQGTYYDKNSGQSVTVTNQTAETYGTDNTRPIYLGFSNLLGSGLSKFQLDALESAFDSFASLQSPSLREFSIKTSSIKVTQHNPDSSNTDKLSFTVVVDRKVTYIANVEYYDITNIKLKLTKNNGEEVYSSKEIDGSKINN